MSFMKKTINNILKISLFKELNYIIILVLIVMSLTSCKKNYKIWVYEQDYSLINQNLTIDFFTNIKKNPYLKKENISNIFLFDDDNKDLIPVIIEKYSKEQNNKGEYIHRYVLNLNLSYLDLLKVKNAFLVIEYINDYNIKINIGSVASIKVEENYDLSVNLLEGNIDNNHLESINIGIINNSNQKIIITDIYLINAKEENKLIEYEIVTSKIINIPIENSSVVNTGIIIKYLINDEYKYKITHSFRFINDYQAKDNIYYVTN